MKKRKKNGTGRQDDSQQPEVPGSEMDLSGIEISQLSDAELEAVTAPDASMG